MYKRIFLHKDMMILCVSLSAVKTSALAEGIQYRFMDMAFAKFKQKSGTVFMLAVDDEPERDFKFETKKELCTFIEHHTKQVMKKMQEAEDEARAEAEVVPEDDDASIDSDYGAGHTSESDEETSNRRSAVDDNICDKSV